MSLWLTPPLADWARPAIGRDGPAGPECRALKQGRIVAPRILVDATAVPADRGALGRYVAGPTAIAHRQARLAWEQTGLPFIAQQVDAQVIHLPYYSIPLRPGMPTVATIHDVTYFSEPEVHNPVKSTYIKSATRTACRRATRLIVPSKATRDELVRLLAANPTRIDVAYHGVDHEAFHRPAEDELRRVSDRLGLHGHQYIAFLGALEPRKKVPNLIRAWVRAVSDRPDPPALVLAGGGGWDDEVGAGMATVPLQLGRDHFLVRAVGALGRDVVVGRG